MKAGPGQQRVQSRAMSIGRPVVAAILALSFLSVLLPLSVSAGSTGLKACCIGKSGHESGSCSTGLIKSGAQTRVLEVSPPKERSNRFAKVKCGAGAGDHCHPSANIDSQPDVTEAENATEQFESTSTSRVGDSLSIHSVRSTCPAECSACSVGYTRRPRPREQSTQSALVTPRLPSLILVFVGDDQQARLLNWKWSQLQPRAPPALLV